MFRRLRFVQFALLLVPGLLLQGCRLLTPSDPWDDFDAAVDRWYSRGYISYSYQVSRSCFCGYPGVGRPVVVVVHDGVPVAAWDAETGAPYAGIETFPTVDDLFDLAEDAIRRADDFHIRYHGSLGYPTEIDIDYIRNGIDDELFVSSSRLERIE